MKSLKIVLCAGLAACALHAFAGNKLPMAEWPAAYSVEMETEAGGMKTAIKMFVDGEKQRTEMNAGGMEMISIMRKDQKKVYGLMPAQKMVTESPMPEIPAAEAPSGPEPVCEKVGTTTIEGVNCTEFKVTAGSNTTTWFLNSDNLPVRMVAAGNTTTWKNLKIGAQDASLFEIPAGYSKPGEAAATSDTPAASDEGGAPAEEKPAKKKKKGLGGMLGR